MAKKVPQINASSMADISFLLLIFFLVTTSMDVNQGLARRLPAPIPPDQKIEDTDINKRNLMVVKINSANQLMVQGQLTDIKQLRKQVKEFVLNVNDDAYMPKLFEEDFGEPIGVQKYTKELKDYTDTHNGKWSPWLYELIEERYGFKPYEL